MKLWRSLREMNKRLIIVGKGGHAKVCADIASQRYDVVEYLDDDLTKNVLGRLQDYEKYVKDSDFFIAIGDNETRERITNRLRKANVVTLIHNKSVIAKDAIIGKGTVIMAGVVINSSTVVGAGCIINTCSSLDHDNFVGNYSHISVGAHLAGNVKVGNQTFIGAGTTIINNITICDNVIVGAGSVVVKNIDEKGTFFGVPAKKR